MNPNEMIAIIIKDNPKMKKMFGSYLRAQKLPPSSFPCDNPQCKQCLYFSDTPPMCNYFLYTKKHHTRRTKTDCVDFTPRNGQRITPDFP